MPCAGQLAADRILVRQTLPGPFGDLITWPVIRVRPGQLKFLKKVA